MRAKMKLDKVRLLSSALGITVAAIIMFLAVTSPVSPDSPFAWHSPDAILSIRFTIVVVCIVATIMMIMGSFVEVKKRSNGSS